MRRSPEDPLRRPDTLLHGLLMPCSRAATHAPGVQVQVAINNGFSSLTHSRSRRRAARSDGAAEPARAGVGDIQTAVRVTGLSEVARAQCRDGVVPWVGTESRSRISTAKWLRKHVDESRVRCAWTASSARSTRWRTGLGAGLLLCPLATRAANSCGSHRPTGPRTQV